MLVNHFSLAFKRARESRNMTQVQLAEAVGCSKGTIQRLEGGSEWTTADVPLRVANALGMRLSAIIKFAEACSPEDPIYCASALNNHHPMP